MIQFRRSEINSVDNQKFKISLYSGGNPVIPSELNIAVFELNSPEKVLSPIKIFPFNGDMWPLDIGTSIASGGSKIQDGQYLPLFQLPHDASIGRSKIVYYYKTHSSQPEYTTFEEEFESIDYLEVYGSDGPPIVPISEIRMFLRDNPEFHVLIDNYLFTDSNIMVAARQTVDRFNRINPPLGEFGVYNFPDSYLLTIGITSWLFESEANRQLMEQLTYQDGNIHHGLTDKTQLYREAARMLKTEFEAIAREVKLNLNINGIYDGTGLGVRFRYNRYYGRRVY